MADHSVPGEPYFTSGWNAALAEAAEQIKALTVHRVLDSTEDVFPDGIDMVERHFVLAVLAELRGTMARRDPVRLHVAAALFHEAHGFEAGPFIPENLPADSYERFLRQADAAVSATAQYLYSKEGQ